MPAAEQMLLLADVARMGDGRMVITPRAPAQEVGTRAAAKLLGYKRRASIFESVLNHPLAEKYLRWRYLPGGGKILIETASLLAFKEAIKDHGK